MITDMDLFMCDYQAKFIIFNKLSDPFWTTHSVFIVEIRILS